MDVHHFNKAVGTHIRNERKALGFSQADLAHALGLSRPALNNIEAGRQNLYAHMLYQIAYELGIPVVCLFPTSNEIEQEIPV